MQSLSKLRGEVWFDNMSSLPSDIVLPPNEIKQTIEKTVGYVIKNGKSFEERLLNNNKNDKFDFINPDNEHYPYYKWKLTTLQDQAEKTPDESQNDQDIIIPTPRELSFLIELPVISKYDLDVIKTTALYIAQNGKEKIPDLLNHETVLGKKAQFEFLNDSHSLNCLFQKYVDQYKSIIKLYKSENHPLQKRILPKQQHFTMLTEAYDRAQFIKQNTVNEKKAQEVERERQLHYALIDWQDFTLVAKVDFDAIDEVQELSVPLKRDDLIKRSLEAKSKEVELPKAAVVQREEHKEDEPKEVEAAVVPGPFKGMKIKPAGTSRLKKSSTPASTAKSTIKCPITGKLIPESEFDNHLRTLLRDPRYKKEQENYIKKNFTYASNITTDQVYENIKRLVKKRSTNEDGQQSKRPK
ncbi:MAG: SURP domain-containing protein [Asgard group archaeon]|nr:SURP domain-containing protein [Asgard group archaeon]